MFFLPETATLITNIFPLSTDDMRLVIGGDKDDHLVKSSLKSERYAKVLMFRHLQEEFPGIIN